MSYNQNPFNDQLEFMQASGQTAGIYNDEQLALYFDLIEEEYTEMVTSQSVEGLMKEMADLLVVTIGAMYSLGVNPQEVWNIVHASNMSNMSKIDPVSEKIEKREDGKVLKGPNYKAPDLREIASLIQGLPNE